MSPRLPVPEVYGFTRPDCREVDDDGTVRVRLGVSAREWFNLTHELGEVLCLTRNPVACLARLGPPPAVDDWRNPWLPRATSGAFAPNLAEWAELWAVREVRTGCLMWSLDVRDPRGQTTHRLVLGENSRRQAYEHFVREHQVPCATARPWLPPNHAASAGRRARVATRIAFLHLRSGEGAADARRLDPGAVGEILGHAAQLRLPLRIGLYASTGIHTAPWLPDTPSDTDGEGHFFHGEGTGLHLNPAALGTAWLWTGRCPCCDAVKWSIEVGDHEHRLALALTALEADQEPAWRELLTALIQP